VDLSNFLTIAGPAFEHLSGKSRTSLISLISTHLQPEELDALEDKGMAELLCFWDKINECQTVREASPADQANILNQENEHESQQSQVKEKNGEQAKLSKETEALQLKLSLMQTQND